MIDLLRKRMQQVSATDAAQDVAPFLPATEQASLTLWSESFFADGISMLAQTVSVDV